mgnify:FL=1
MALFKNANAMKNLKVIDDNDPEIKTAREFSDSCMKTLSWRARCHLLEEENEKLTEENKKLNDDDWVIDCHKALKYKIVLTEDNYAELQSEIVELKEEKKKLKEDNLHFAEEIGNLEDEIEDRKEELGGYMVDIEELEEAAVRRARFWQCLMDCIDNPDNPSLNEVGDWCKAYNISDEIRKELEEDFS